MAEVRDRVRALFRALLEDDRTAERLEKCTYNVVLETAQREHVPRYWDSARFRRMYGNKARSLLFNLKNPETPHLRADILAARDLPDREAIAPLRRLVRMTHQEMHPELWAPVYAELHRKAMRGKPMLLPKDHVGLFRCGRCKSMRTLYNLLQTRSADEPSTAFIVCDDCGNRWRKQA